MSDRHCPLRQAALDSPQGIALLSETDSYTFLELDRQADHLAHQLHKFHIGQGDRIALWHPPCASLIALFFAAWRQGASICPLNLRLPKESLPHHLHQIAPKLFVDSLPLQKTIHPTPPSCPRSIFLFTSGSTATPKIAVLSLDSLLASAASYPQLDLQPQDRWLLSLPLFHVGGIAIVLRCLLARATLVFNANDPNITHLSHVPTQLFRATPIYPHLKCLLLGGAPILSYPTQLPIYGTYGLTEMGSWVLARKQPPYIQGHYHLGRSLPHGTICLSPTGEILVRGASLFQGYWKQGALFPPSEWFATGDLGSFHPQEGFAIIGRKDWQFISGGENIQPEEIEQAMMQIPDILDAAILPKPDAEMGQRPIAFVRTCKAHFTLHQLQSALQPHLPKYKIPTALFLVDDMPKNGLKIDRKKLFDLLNRNTLKIS